VDLSSTSKLTELPVYRSIEVTNLIKKRESAGARFRLEIPEFYVDPGEFVAIVGESGCGKSTLLDMFALVLRPTTSDSFDIRTHNEAANEIQALWDANDEDALSSVRRDLLGYVLQAGGLFPYLTVRENASVPRKLKGLKQNDLMVQETAAAIGLAMKVGDDEYDYSLLDKKPRHLSGGQRQRSAILRALLSEPSIILADEPTAAVDMITGESIIRAFKEIAQKNKVSVVMVTHDRHLVSGNVDRAYTFKVTHEESTGFVVSRMVDLAVEEL